MNGVTNDTAAAPVRVSLPVNAQGKKGREREQDRKVTERWKGCLEKNSPMKDVGKAHEKVAAGPRGQVSGQ